MYREVKKPELLGIAAEWNRLELERGFDDIDGDRAGPVDELSLVLDWNTVATVLQMDSV